MSYPDTADCYSLYHALLNTLLCLIQVSLSNSPFTLKSECFEYVPILDLDKIRSKIGTYSKHADFKEIGLLERLTCIKQSKAFNRA